MSVITDLINCLYLRGILGKYVEWMTVCPEVEYGLPIPCETMSLVGGPKNRRLMNVKNKIDHSGRILTWT